MQLKHPVAVGLHDDKGRVVGRAMAGDVGAFELAGDGFFVGFFDFAGSGAGAVFPADRGAFAHGGECNREEEKQRICRFVEKLFTDLAHFMFCTREATKFTAFQEKSMKYNFKPPNPGCKQTKSVQVI